MNKQQQQNFPLVTIVTVCYNSEKTLKRTIESVLSQSYSHIEYIIVDGQSSDRTVNLAEKYVSDFERKGYEYTIFSEKDNGLYDAMNKGIDRSNGELIGIINSDDWYEPNAVEFMVNRFLEKRYDLFFADINIVKQDGTIIRKKSRKDIFPSSRHWNHPTTFVRRSVYEELGTFRNTGIHDDFDFFLRVKKAKKNIEIMNVVLANFCLGGTSNDKSLKKCKKRIIDRYSCYRNNGYCRLYMIECVCIEIAKFIIG